MAKDPYHSRVWRTLRLHVLARDGHVCQIKGPGCTRTATHADHIIPWRDGPQYWYDPTNLRAACAHCNTGRRNEPKRYSSTPSRNW